MSDLMKKLTILGAAAKFDASCSSSGGGRAGKPGQLGNTCSAGICHTWAADGRCVSLLKVLLSNACCYDCAYCVNRRSSDVERATFTPAELAELTVSFYRRNYIEGLFLSSGVLKSPDYTMELMGETLRLLREDYHFGGYIHVKVIPGADSRMVNAIGLLADRVSVNVELPSREGLSLLAPQKTPENIFAPMNHIQRAQTMSLEDRRHFKTAPLFAPAGQATQMIVGATPDTDLTILRLSHALYRKYRLKRVYFSAYIPVGENPALPAPGSRVPLLREHRLYQADWLLRFYDFQPDELLSESAPLLDPELDPKCVWALAHPERFPVEVNTADYETLLRVPGLGVVSAKRILAARRQGHLTLDNLRKLGVVMKRAQYFLIAAGKFGGRLPPGSPFLREALAERTNNQLSLFTPTTDPVLPALPQHKVPLLA
ncbi:MAG: putative DNA modification/repair radical SAM protein [Oscillospiraceae bacterium]|jgi:putative DNA modification/repair radical SAM protein|nr:putative DNA modification/repair radical SAM protein [Oscillospiraceae bacterium]